VSIASVSFASTSVTRDTHSVHPFPLYFSLPMLTKFPSAQLQRRRRRPEPLSCLCRRSRDPETPLEVTNLLHPLFPFFVALSCAQLLIGER
jgi:hypothetical protein